MKETSLLDVLLLLVSKHIEEQPEAEQVKLRASLEAAGLTLEKVSRVAAWLKELLQNIEWQANPRSVVRVFSPFECEKLDVLSRGCISFLEHTGALTPVTREWLIDHAMKLEIEQVGINELRLLMPLVLVQQYGQLNLAAKRKNLIITDPRKMH